MPKPSRAADAPPPAGTEPTAPKRRTAAKILVVDDERSMRDLLSIVLRREGHDVFLAENGHAAVSILEQEPIDLLISDIKMPEMTGVEVLRAAKRIDREIPGIMITAFASTETAVEALREGATDYVTKPFDVDELKIKVRAALERRQLWQENVVLRQALRAPHEFGDILGQSDAMLSVFRLVEMIAPTNSTVLISGESGTGKELVARAIHANSLRGDRPFVPVNCGALPETLLESELFGHIRGSFTGAVTNKKGLIEVADKGTIFLDEISEMSPLMQVKLLRVLQERKFRRLGGPEEIDADIRVIAATNRDLGRFVSEGRFREDLYYRVNVIPVHLPPLRERREDIPLLARHFAATYGTRMGKDLRGVSGDALRELQAYDWPGNVRELENAMERAVALERTPTILSESLPEHVRAARLRALVPGQAAPSPLPDSGFDLERHVQGIEREYIAEALRQSGGVQVKAASLLGMSFRSLRYYVRKYNLR